MRLIVPNASPARKRVPRLTLTLVTRPCSSRINWKRVGSSGSPEIAAMMSACSAGDTVMALPLRPRLNGATIGTLTCPSPRLEAIATGVQPTPSFADGLQVQRVLGAVEQSSASHGVWTATAA